MINLENEKNRLSEINNQITLLMKEKKVGYSERSIRRIFDEDKEIEKNLSN